MMDMSFRFGKMVWLAILVLLSEVSRLPTQVMILQGI